MRAGRLRFVAELQNPSSTGSQYSTSVGYSTVDSKVRVDVQPLSGTEMRGVQQQGGSVSAEIFMRYHPLVTSASRLVVNGVTYEVAAPVNLNNRNRGLRLQCKVVS